MGYLGSNLYFIIMKHSCLFCFVIALSFLSSCVKGSVEKPMKDLTFPSSGGENQITVSFDINEIAVFDDEGSRVAVVYLRKGSGTNSAEIEWLTIHFDNEESEEVKSFTIRSSINETGQKRSLKMWLYGHKAYSIMRIVQEE